jgi:hypothetical protein
VRGAEGRSCPERLFRQDEPEELIRGESLVARSPGMATETGRQKQAFSCESIDLSDNMPYITEW